MGRLAPNAPNVTPLGGSCLSAGSRVAGARAGLPPLILMAATDPFLGGFPAVTPVIYAAFLINVRIGRTMLRETTATKNGGGGVPVQRAGAAFPWADSGRRSAVFGRAVRDIFGAERADSGAANGGGAELAAQTLTN